MVPFILVLSHLASMIHAHTIHVPRFRIDRPTCTTRVDNSVAYNVVTRTAIVPNTVEQSTSWFWLSTPGFALLLRAPSAFSRRLQPVFTTRKMDDTHGCLRYNSRRKQCTIINASESNVVDELNCRSVLSRRASLGKRRPSHLLVRLLIRLPRRLEEWREMKKRRSGNWISVTGRPIAWVDPGRPAASLFARASAPSLSFCL